MLHNVGMCSRDVNIGSLLSISLAAAMLMPLPISVVESNADADCDSTLVVDADLSISSIGIAFNDEDDGEGVACCCNRTLVDDGGVAKELQPGMKMLQKIMIMQRRRGAITLILVLLLFLCW